MNLHPIAVFLLDDYFPRDCSTSYPAKIFLFWLLLGAHKKDRRNSSAFPGYTTDASAVSLGILVFHFVCVCFSREAIVVAENSSMKGLKDHAKHENQRLLLIAHVLEIV